ncbi:unnamed protein product [Adineta ricciae]|uniref:Neurotransmitter-gated ion-channel ligand-binding domain-containing protein n=1 Tax=Adineta ricciae TaxID=249248 RepID=A0A815FFU9_ADIRI|nr:unnamed protein product [Adineta ricciae]CAF1337530.1 unnamed protein product [Adineta ricciae]
MIQLSICMIIIILSVQASSEPVGTTIDPKHELLTEIVGRYRLAARHFRESQTILPFDIQFPVHEILKIDSSTNEYVFRATIQLDYQFDLLHWDVNDTRIRYRDIDEILLTKTLLQSLWLPDIHLLDDDSLSFDIENESAKVTRDGQIRWIRRGLFKIISPIDLTYYPFDRQYLRLDMYNREQRLKLQYQEMNISNIISEQPRPLSVWSRIFDIPDLKSSNENNSFTFQHTNHTSRPILSRGWFIRTLGIEPKLTNQNLDKLSIYVLMQRRRESHIYTTILPTLFFSVFIFVFYFASIESYQRLIVGLLHIFATLMFIIHLDRKISAEQLSYTPLIIRYLSIIFLLEILSLFFDHIIHLIYYGGIHFISNWLCKNGNDETQGARLSQVKLLTRGSHRNYADHSGGSDFLLKKLVEREESLKIEDYQRYQWHKQARLSECLCCSFFLFIILAIFVSMFFIFPTFALSKMT